MNANNEQRELPAVINVRLGSDLTARMEDWRCSQIVPPTRTAVIAAAVVEWLDKHDGKGTG